MQCALFSYGTLMFAPVRRLHSRRPLATEPAVLSAYARHALRGASYPGVISEAGARVQGMLVRGISPRSISAPPEGARAASAVTRVTVRLSSAP